MIEVNGHLTCLRGEMGLSQVMRAVLEKRFPQQVRPEVETDFKLGWYCPGCGIPLDSQHECSHCGKSIKGIMYPLVEFHPHKNEQGVWR